MLLSLKFFLKGFILKLKSAIILFFILSSFLIAQQNNNFKKALEGVYSSKATERRRSIYFLGEKRYQPAFQIIIKKLKDPDKMVRAVSVWALGRLRRKAGVDFLIESLYDKSWQVKCAGLSALEKFRLDRLQEKRVSFLSKKLLFDPNWQVRHMAVCQLRKRSCIDVIPLLHKIFFDKKEHVYVLVEICKFLGKFGNKRSIFVLIRGLKSEISEVRLYSNRALIDIAPRYKKKLIDIFRQKQNELWLRYNIGLILGRSKTKEVLPFALRIAQDKSEAGKIRYISILLSQDFQGQKISPLLLKLLDEENMWVQRGAILSLGKFANKKALPKFWKILQNENGKLQEEILWALSKFPRQEIEPLVLPVLKSSKENQLFFVCIRLAGIFRMHKATKFLRKLPKNHKWYRPISWALKRIEE